MTPTRREIFRMIEEMSDRYPDWRFGKIVANVSFRARGPEVESIWDVEDEEFLQAVREHLEKRRNVLREPA